MMLLKFTLFFVFAFAILHSTTCHAHSNALKDSSKRGPNWFWIEGKLMCRSNRGKEARTTITVKMWGWLWNSHVCTATITHDQVEEPVKWSCRGFVWEILWTNNSWSYIAYISYYCGHEADWKEPRE